MEQIKRLTHNGIDHFDCGDCPLRVTCEEVCPELERMMRLDNLQDKREQNLLNQEDQAVLTKFITCVGGLLTHTIKDTEYNLMDFIGAAVKHKFDYKEINKLMGIKKEHAELILIQTADMLDMVVNGEPTSVEKVDD